jgi:Ser/Thr protein kinase RdoA (MazF antagonist)
MTALTNDRSSASAAIRRVMEAYELVRDRDAAEVAHARSALTRHIQQLVAAGETNEERLAVAGIIYLKSLPTAQAV